MKHKTNSPLIHDPRFMIHEKGFSTLPAILFLGGLLVEIAIALTLLLHLVGQTSFAARASAEAYEAARGGLEDGIIKVVRNKQCPTSGCASPYTVSAGDQQATVSLCKDTCAGAGRTAIVSVGPALLFARNLRAVVAPDALTGKTDILSIEEVAL